MRVEPTQIPTTPYGEAADGTVLGWQITEPANVTSDTISVILIPAGEFRYFSIPGQVARDIAAAGFRAIVINHRLAPPAKDMPNQRTVGHAPLQTDDVATAIREARKTSPIVKCVGGSAGASHAAFKAHNGVRGEDLLDAAACLSGIYAMADEESLNDPRRQFYANDLYNYVDSQDRALLQNASPIEYVRPDGGKVMIISSQEDTIPPPQHQIYVQELKRIGASVKSKVLQLEPAADGFTLHAWKLWDLVKNDVINFLKQS